MTSRQDALRLAQQLDAQVEGTGDGAGVFTVTAEAPDGMRWVGHDVHEVVMEGGAHEPAERTWRAILDAMLGGLEPCTDAECEWCDR